jgi:hypothetical protein
MVKEKENILVSTKTEILKVILNMKMGKEEKELITTKMEKLLIL